MRIIRGHDYYDSALAYGVDREVVFVRDGVKKDEKFLPPVYSGAHSLWNRDNSRRVYRGKWDIRSYAIVVYVCGLRYSGVEVEWMRDKNPRKRECFWSFDDAEKFVNDFGATFKSHYSFDDKVEKYFGCSEKERDKCIEEKVIVATWERDSFKEKASWLVNGDTLKKYEFYRVMDPYKCFQEISMFIGGVLPRVGAEMVEISDKSKIAKHGMDKWSFRKKGVNSDN